jgi:hypothetical protein
MAPTITPVYLFQKPDTEDLYAVTVQNGNWDKAEAGMIALAASSGGFTFCTSTTRPATPAAGKLIYETDTRRGYIWNSTVWFQMFGPPAPVALTMGATIATNCALGRKFRGTMTTNGVLQAPTNAVDGMDCIWEISADTSIRTLSVQTGVAGGFVFGSDITALTATEANKTDIVGAMYVGGTINRWRLTSYAKGFTAT